jgi:putative ABC transport system permease protein
VLVVVFLLIASVMGVVGLIGLGSTMSTNVIERTREFGIMSAIGASASSVRRIVVGEGVFMDAGVGNLFLSTPILFRFSTIALLAWAVVIVLGAALATLAPAFRASRLTVREALAYL